MPTPGARATGGHMQCQDVAAVHHAVADAGVPEPRHRHRNLPRTAQRRLPARLRNLPRNRRNVRHSTPDYSPAG